MTVVKIIIFLLTMAFLFLAAKAKTDEAFIRFIIPGFICLILFFAIQLIFFTDFSIASMCLMLATVFTLCNRKEPKKILIYAIPIFIIGVIAGIIAL